jgi:hypothetical protein
VDILAVPRDKLSGLTWNGGYLNVHAAGGSLDEIATVSLVLDPALVEAMRLSFGSAVDWR